jgi:hypothetical protein
MSSSMRAIPEVGTAFIILGADAVLAALPASPVQLAHACQALGFQLAAPATWGDELIAERCLDQLAGYAHPTAVMCSCPLVTERLTRASTTLEPFMLTFASPPVATARYLRAAFSGQTLHITYAGSCPGADDDSIDARLRPSELLDAFVEHGIIVGAQPNCFDALVPLDRRRFYSLPGGIPTRDHVERAAGRALVELTGSDDAVLELTQHLIEQAPALIDLAMPLGCACAGAGPHALRGNTRSGLLTLEPPRARQAVLDQSVEVDVAQTLIEACALHANAAEEEAPLEVHLAADSAPSVERDAKSVEPVVRRHADVEANEASVDAVVAADSNAGADANVAADAVVDVEVTAANAVVDIEVVAADAVVDIEVVGEVAAYAEVHADADAVAYEVADTGTIQLSRRRPVIVRAPASLPRYATQSGELVPRASLAALRRALERSALRNARRQPKIERGRRDRSTELREGLSRSITRTPRSLAIAAADLRRPVPPPPAPARRRPRTMLEL